MGKRSSSEREFTGWHMLGVMVLFFGTVIGVNLTLAFYANSSWSGLVVANSYVAGQSFNEEAEKARQQAALGFEGKPSATASGLDFEFLDRDGRPVLAESIEVKIGRPSYETEDRVLQLAYLGEGRYRAETPLASGQWQADLTARLADGDWRMRWRFTIAHDEGESR